MPKPPEKSPAGTNFGYEAQRGQMAEARYPHLFAWANGSMSCKQVGEGEAVSCHGLGAEAA